MGELHSGFDLKDGENIDLEETLGTNGTWCGHTCNGVAGEDVVFPNLCYLESTGKFFETDADSAGTTDGFLVIASATIATDGTGVFILPGSFIRHDAWAWTKGGALYVSLTKNELTQTAPSSPGDQVRKVGYAVTADIIWFEPDSTIIGV